MADSAANWAVERCPGAIGASWVSIGVLRFSVWLYERTVDGMLACEFTRPKRDYQGYQGGDTVCLFTFHGGDDIALLFPG
jgi:hypothetical protein